MSDQATALTEAVKRRRLVNEAARALAKEAEETKEEEGSEETAPSPH